MQRLTTDRPDGNLQAALNVFYAKDGEAWVRGGGPGPEYPDVTLNDYIRRAIGQVATCQPMFDELDDQKLAEVMADWCMDENESQEGIIGTLYAAGWVCAELRARLKMYEDTGLMPGQVAALRWIPVAVQLPGDEEVQKHYAQYGEHPKYIVMIAGAVQSTVLAFDGEDFYDPADNEIYKVTHWMPLPAAPEVQHE